MNFLNSIFDHFFFCFFFFFFLSLSLSLTHTHTHTRLDDLFDIFNFMQTFSHENNKKSWSKK